MQGHAIAAVLGAFLLFLCIVPADIAHTSGKKSRQEILTAQKLQRDTEREVQGIKKSIRTKPSWRDRQGPFVRDVVFNLGENPVTGAHTAKLTLIEFNDYQCGYCARHIRETYPRIEKNYIKTGKIRYVLLDLPLERIHKLAFKAAEATHCAEEQGKYWEMRARLYQHQRALEPWGTHAEALGMIVSNFMQCLSSGKYASAVRRDMAEARKAGATGTPSFILATTDPDNPTEVKGLSFLRGAQPFSSFKAEIDKALTEAAAK